MMNDLMENVQDVFKKWEARGASNFNTRGRRGYSRGSDRSSYRRSEGYSDYSSSYNRPGERRFRQRDRIPFFKLPKYDGLAQFKMAPCVMALNKQRPFMGGCCSKCLPLSRASVADTKVFSLSVCNVLHIPIFHSFDVSFVLNILKKKKKLEYPDVSSNVLKSKSVLSAVQETVEECLEDCDDNETLIANEKVQQLNRVKKVLELMKSSISSVCLQISSLFLHSVLSRMFDGVLVHKGQLEILQSSSQESVPIIYIPLYQSSFDCVLISFILFMNSLKSPLVATDQDLYIPIFKYLLKSLGAFFIRNHLKKRYCDEDTIYESVLQSYISESLKAGHNLEFFIDEDLSLVNKHHMNKCDLLSIVTESILKGSLEDAYISTVSISYEKFLQRTFVYEQLGQSEEKESSFNFLYSFWRITHRKFGNVRLNFGQPFSIKEFLQSFKQNLPSKIPNAETPPSSPSSDKTTSIQQDLEDEHLQFATKNLAQHVIYDATSSTSLMSTHLLAFLLLIQFRKGATQQQLQNRMDWLRGELTNKKQDTGFTGQSLPVIKRAVELLGKDLISSETIDMEWTSSDLENNNMKVIIYKPATKLPHVFELQCYAKKIVPVFLLDSLVVNALYAIVDVDICHFRHCDSLLYVRRNLVIDKAVELSDILQFEFIAIPPCSDIALSFSDTIDELIEKECLSESEVKPTLSRSKYGGGGHLLSFNESDEEGDSFDNTIVIQPELKIDLTEESITHLEFLRNILSSYIESYWLSACTLLKLVDEVKEESVFIQEMQLTAQEKLYKGLLAYEESFSAVTFKNSLKLFESWHVIESYVQDGMKIVYLNENYNNKDCINDVIAKIEEFRK